jgi:hypothetical protein
MVCCHGKRGSTRPDHPTLDGRRLPARGEEPRRRIERRLDDERECTAAVGASDEDAAIRPLRTPWIPGDWRPRRTDSEAAARLPQAQCREQPASRARPRSRAAHELRPAQPWCSGGLDGAPECRISRENDTEGRAARECCWSSRRKRFRNGITARRACRRRPPRRRAAAPGGRAPRGWRIGGPRCRA